MKKHNVAIHIFRRDLRLYDNTSLNYALENSKEVIPCFILDKRQLEENKYRSEAAVNFMLNSLLELDSELNKKKSRLYVFYGETEKIIEKLLCGCSLLTINRDYTPFSRERDERIRKICVKNDVKMLMHADSLLCEPEELHKDDKKPYTVFTPFFNKAKKVPVRKPQRMSDGSFFKGNLGSDDKIINNLKSNGSYRLMGGRKEGLKLLDDVKKLRDYSSVRDIPSKDQTSHLSAHNKFSTISIREFYYRVIDLFGPEHQLINELYWRDFFTHICFHFPHVIGKPFNKRFEDLKWVDDRKLFRLWCEGKTGFPIVDAGMRELNETGYMHNRLRMIVSSFLVKDLHIDWRWGERYFAQRLIDYDPAVNNGNWQWAASTGCDAQPYFRIFNPWRQQDRFDPDCSYIKRWVPELFETDCIDIREGKGYISPIVDHKQASAEAKAMYAFVSRN